LFTLKFFGGGNSFSGNPNDVDSEICDDGEDKKCLGDGDDGGVALNVLFVTISAFLFFFLYACNLSTPNLK
jgi:hypothetical protein